MESIKLCHGISEYVLAVEEAVACGFGEMFGADIRLGGKVGYGTGEFDDTCTGSGGKAHTVNYLFEDLLAGVIQRTVFLYKTVVHGGIAEDPVISKAEPLYFTSLKHPGRNYRTRLCRTTLDKLTGIDRMHPELYVYTTE